MNALPAQQRDLLAAREIRVRGLVQGVGFRPTVWRLAEACGLRGEVLNDSAGVLIRAVGTPSALARFLDRLRSEAPPLARIDAVETRALADGDGYRGFAIAASGAGAMRTHVVPDAATCAACLAEVLSPFERRFRYPFTNCTHCGPRFSIVDRPPYDRANTSMAAFALCDACRREYEDPADRRFHAQPVACHGCGPRVALERMDGRPVLSDSYSMLDAVDAAASLIQKGEIVAIKGLGGYHLACDATDAAALERLRRRKRRYGKAFALMARDLGVIARYCMLGPTETALLESPAAPIVLLPARGEPRLPDAVAPGLSSLGFMLPYTPLHHLMFRRLDRPVVMTSGNLSDEPQCVDDEDAKARLGAIADFILCHDRRIANRVDDSVVRVVAGRARVVRRARGYAPSPLRLPAGFEAAPGLLAMGGELKSAFCLLKDGEAVLSQHQGDLENEPTLTDYLKNLGLYAQLYAHQPEAVAVDLHPDYLSTKHGRELAGAGGLRLVPVQHHHAHVASCMAENGRALDAGPVLGVALDGLGLGDDGTIWGGEFLLADYRGYRRLATFKPVAMPGGAQAIREPWRNAYAHIVAEMGWPAFAMNFDGLELYRQLDAKPIETLARMLAKGINAPLASSCGRLFDAVAAAMGVCADEARYEGEAAMRLEALAEEAGLTAVEEDLAYPFGMPNLKGSGLPYIEPLMMWQALLGDLHLDTPKPVMAARFHKGLARAVAAMVAKVSVVDGADGADGANGARVTDTVALTGGCFQNKLLFEEVARRLEAAGFRVLGHAAVPANDGGLALGQAAVAAAQLMTA